MTSLIVLPSIQSGIYRISSLSPELYLELQSDNSLRATKLNKSSDSQKWEISPDEDGTYEIKCVLGNRDLLCEIHPTHNNPLGHSGMMSKSLWTIDPRGVAFAIANARDNRVLDLVLDDRVGFSERDGVRGQRWILHLDDTLVLREKMAAIQPYSIPPQKLHPSLHQPQERCPVPNPLRIRKAPPTQGVVREGIYRIASSIRRSEGACFLELQEDNSIKVVALNETSKGQQWMFTHYQNSKYFIKSSLNSHALAIRPSVNDSNLRVPVGDDSFASAWTIEPRHDAYFIGVLDDIRVLDLTENNTVVFENLNGCTTQQWDLDPVRF